MVGFPKYESYKDSGVEWLGEIPSHWGIKRAKYCFSIVMGQSPNSNHCNNLVEGLPFLQGNADFGRISPTPKIYCTVPTKISKVGDILVSVRAPVGQLNISDQKYVIGRGLCALTSNLFIINPNFAWHCLQYFREQLAQFATGSTYDGVSVKDVGEILITIPPIEEQNRIVKFLDRKTYEIDQAIAQKQRLIELLQEQKAILINQAVTKGLDPNVPMCDRRIEWIGEVPEHWTIGKLKFFLQSVDYGLSESALSDGEYKYLNMGHIQDKKVLVENTGYLNSITDNLLLETNDVLFNRTNSFDLVGKSGIFKGARTDKVTFASYLVRLRPIKSVIPDWLNYLLNDVSFLSYIRSLALRSLNQANLNPNRLSAVHVPVPPTAEQIKIAEFISTMEKEINKQITIAQRTIELYEELKNTYISNAVTGKIKI